MPIKSKIADEEIRKYINEGKSNAQIAKALGVKQPNINVRINKLRKEYGDFLPNPGQLKEPVPKPAPSEKQESKPVMPIETESSGSGATLSFDEIKPGDKLLRNGRPIDAICHEKDKKLREKDKLTIKDRFGYTEKVSRKYFDDNPGKFVRDPKGKPATTIEGYDIVVNGKPIKESKTIFEKVYEAANNPERKPGMTINPEFEAAVQEMEAGNKKVGEKAELIEKIITEKPELAPVALAIENELAERERIEDEIKQHYNLDLEMDSISDPVQPFKSVPDDYTDPEWFDKPIPRKGTVERAIWDKAYKEIEEIRTLRNTILSALNRGERLPNTDVGLYNKYVSKYSEEVGA